MTNYYTSKQLCACGGEYVATNTILTCDPPLYPHKCNKCGNIENFDREYPQYVFKVKQLRNLTEDLSWIEECKSDKDLPEIDLDIILEWLERAIKAEKLLHQGGVTRGHK